MFLLYKVVAPALLLWCKLTGCKIEGRENLPKDGAVVAMANHIHVYDPLIVAAAWWQVKRPVHFMAKANFFHNKFVNKLFRTLGAFPIKRGEADITALKTALEILKKTEVLGIFPEGTRNKNATNTLLEFKQGAVLLAYKAKAPVIPMAVINSGNLFRFWRPRPKIVIAKPVTFLDEKRPAKEITAEYTELVRQNIGGLLNK